MEIFPKFSLGHPGFEEDAKQLNPLRRSRPTPFWRCVCTKLIGLEILALQKEYKECLKRIAEYEKVLKSRDGMNKVIKEDLTTLRKNLLSRERLLIENGKEAVYEESAVAVAEVVFVMDRFGYCKLLDRSAYDRETVDTEYKCDPCLNTDKLCIFYRYRKPAPGEDDGYSVRKLRVMGGYADNLS